MIIRSNTYQGPQVGLILFAALFANMSSLFAACDKNIENRIEYKLNRVLRDVETIIEGNTGTCTPISQEEINLGGGVYTILHSGLYCVNENVTGLIQVAPGVDCVSIDLESHTVTAGASGIAFSADGNEGLKIFNGCITGSTDAAILVTDYTSVELYDLNIHDYIGDGVRIDPSQDVYVHDVNFVSNANNPGERALLFDTVNNFALQRCNASGFLSTVGAVMQFDNCNAGAVADVDVTGCTKTASATTNEFTPGTAFVSVNASTGVDFVHVKVNNNTFDNSVPVADQIHHHRTAEAIMFNLSTDCSLSRCETSNNTDIAGALATPVTEDYILLFINSDTGLITEHQSSNNSSTEEINTFIAIDSTDSTNIIFENCQANKNSAVALNVINVFSQLHGIWIKGAARSRSCIMRNCQANGNSVSFGGSGRSPIVYNPGLVAGIRTNGVGHVIDNCQANYNAMGDSEDFTFVFGIINSTSTNAKTVNSSANNNTGGALSYGIAIHPLFLGVDLGMDQCIENCEANSNGNYGISIGLVGDPLPDLGLDISILNCRCAHNGTVAGADAGGIIVPNQLLSDSNIVISGCQIGDTGTSSSATSAGILVITGNNIEITDTSIFNSNASGEAHGILFDTVTSSKIIRSQMHGNKNSGVELVGTNSFVAIIEAIAMGNDVGFDFNQTSTASCCLVQDCRALSNTTAGFIHATIPLTTTFIGNEAQCNGSSAGDNYQISGGIISLYEQSWSTGMMANISGQPTISRWTNVRAVA